MRDVHEWTKQVCESSHEATADITSENNGTQQEEIPISPTTAPVQGKRDAKDARIGSADKASQVLMVILRQELDQYITI